MHFIANDSRDATARKYSRAASTVPATGDHESIRATRATEPSRAGLRLAPFVVLLQLAGCVITLPSDGPRRDVLVLGAAWIRVGSAQNPDSAQILDVRSAGITLSGSGSLRLAGGLVSFSEIAVPDNANDTRIELSRPPWGPLRIHTNEQVCPVPGSTRHP